MAPPWPLMWAQFFEIGRCFTTTNESAFKTELQALYGARSLLKTVRLILLEVSFVKIYKDCPLFDEVDRFLKESGYRLHAVYPSDQPQNWGDALYVKEGAPA